MFIDEIDAIAKERTCGSDRNDREATLTANLHAADGASGTVEPGNYSLKAVCLEKATGTVTVEVVPAE